MICGSKVLLFQPCDFYSPAIKAPSQPITAPLHLQRAAESNSGNLYFIKHKCSILGGELLVPPRQLSVLFSFSAFELTAVCDCERFIVYGQAVSPGHFYLTLSEARRVVVDVGEGDVDHGGPGEAAPLSSHVFGLNHHLVVLSLLAVHVARAQGCADHT